MLPLKFNLPPSEICKICLLIYHMVTENSIFKWQLITKIKFSDKANIQTLSSVDYNLRTCKYLFTNSNPISIYVFTYTVRAEIII